MPKKQTQSARERGGDEYCRCHNWRRHVPEVIQEAWVGLPLEAKLCVFIMASELTRSEDWD